MDPNTMNLIVAGLLAWIGTHTSYALPNEPPAVALVPHAQIAQLACGGPCEALGVYPDKNVVYIDDGLQIETNVCARSVLLHELVHYLQNRNHRFANIPAVLRPQMREHEAYGVQQMYLAENGRSVAFGPNFYLGAFMGPTC